MIDLIKAATLTNDPEVQKNAEQALLQRRVDTPREFFYENAAIFNNKDLPCPIRQAAGTLLLVSLKIKVPAAPPRAATTTYGTCCRRPSARPART
jgi:hypothetical protein